MRINNLRIVISIASILCFQLVNARRISETEASEKALSFIRHTLKRGSGSALTKSSTLPYVSKTSMQGMYLYNIGDNNGFIIVSEIDAVGIIGYSTSGNLEPENIPDNTMLWLDQYQRIQDLDLSDYLITENIIDQNREVKPLLGEISFGQNAPYNSLCPKDGSGLLSQTGYAATCMAQLMKYHRHPDAGMGSNSYTSSTLGAKLSCTFSDIEINWDMILNSYQPSDLTSTEGYEISSLMLAAGISANTDYSPYCSAADINTAIGALQTNWGYNSNCQIIQRNFIDNDRWYELIINELDAGRPVIYKGEAMKQENMFICDGYDPNGFFHINWGWNGNCDGYYKLNLLNPTSGINDATGMDGFETKSVIAVNLMPDHASNGNPAPVMAYISGLDMNYDVVSRKDPLQYTLNIVNAGIADALYEIFTRMTCPDGTISVKKADHGNIYIAPGEQCELTMSIDSLEKWPDGDYFVSFLACNAGYADTVKLSSQSNVSDYFSIRLSVNSAWAYKASTEANLTLTSDISCNEPYIDLYSRIVVPVRNNSAKTFNSYISIWMINSDNQPYTITNNQVLLEPGEQRDLIFYAQIPGSLSPGTYYFTAAHDIKNSFSSFHSAILPVSKNYKQVTLSKLSSNSPSLSLTDPVGGNTQQTGQLSVNGSITNTGARYYGSVSARLYDANTFKYIEDLQSATVMIEKGESRHFTFSRNNLSIASGKYRLTIAADDKSLLCNGANSSIVVLFESTTTSTGENIISNSGIEYRDGSFIYDLPDYTPVELYDHSGGMIIRCTIGNLNSIELIRGIYLVKVQGKVIRIVI